MSRLQLEPIGLLFLVFYMSILVIQFVAMLLHRFSTLEHIIASTNLFFSKGRSEKSVLSDQGVQYAVERARELQAIRGIDEMEDDVIVSEENRLIVQSEFAAGRKGDQSAEGRPRPRILAQIHEQEANRNVGRGLQTPLEQPAEEGGRRRTRVGHSRPSTRPQTTPVPAEGRSAELSARNGDDRSTRSTVKKNLFTSTPFISSSSCEFIRK